MSVNFSELCKKINNKFAQKKPVRKMLTISFLRTRVASFLKNHI